jgi:hypothetical protein
MRAPTDRARHLIANYATENDERDYNVEKIDNGARCSLLKARAGSGAELGPHDGQKLGALCVIDLVLQGSPAGGGLVCPKHLAGCFSHAFDRHFIGGARHGTHAAEIGPDCGRRLHVAGIQCEGKCLFA